VILLDTCVLSELARTDPHPSVLAWMERTPDASLRISVLTVGEIRKGVELLPEGARRDRYDAWLRGLSRTFADRLLPVDERVALQWGAIAARGRRIGRTWPAIDSLLAATAVCHGLTLATRNVDDFAGAGALLVNPWSG
jgi:toxin FitB